MHVQGTKIPLQLPGVEVRLQPIVALDTYQVLAAEAHGHRAGPRAQEPLGPALRDQEQAHLLRCALAARHRLPPGCLMSLDVPPSALQGAAVRDLLDSLVTLEGLVLELRPEDRWHDDSALLTQLHRLRDRGALLALDDAVPGFTDLFTLCRLQPDWVKVSLNVLRDTAQDPVGRASLELFVDASHQCGAKVVVDGVEHADELGPLRASGVQLAQGAYFSGPLLDRVPSAVVPAPRTPSASRG